MKKKYTSALLLGSLLSIPLGMEAQIRIVNSTTNSAATSSSAFIDASSNLALNSTTNTGKGLLFPRTDLTQFTSFGGTNIGTSSNYPTYYDGLIVYNTATSGVAGVGSTDGTLSSGYWYYDNKSGTETGGTWKRLTTPPSAPYTGSTSVALNGSSFERAALTGDVTASANSNATTISNSAVTTAKIADGAVTTAKIAGSTTNGQVLTTNASGVVSWVTPVDNNTSYTAGSGLTLTGTAFSANDATTSAKGIVQLAGDLAGTSASPSIASNAVTSAKILDGTIATADIANSAITTAKIAGSTTNGQVLTTNASGVTSWVTPTDNNTTYSVNNGLTLTGGNIALGGSLSGSTTIGLGSYNLNFTGTGNIVTAGSFNTSGSVVSTMGYYMPTTNGSIALNPGTSALSGYLDIRKPSNVRIGYIGNSTSNMFYHVETGGVHEFDGQLKITGGSPAAGKVLTSDANGLASWTTPVDNNTVYTAGSGLSLSGSTLSAVDATTSAKGIVQLAGDLSGTSASPSIAANAVTSAKILDGTIATADIANGAVTTAKIAGSTTNGQVLTTNASGVTSWVTPTDNNTTYTVNNGLTLTGGNIALGGSLSGSTTIGLGSYNLNFTGTGNIITAGSFNTSGSVLSTGGYYMPTTNGSITLNPGTSALSGYLDIRKPSNVRIGYIGNSTSNMFYHVETGGFHEFDGQLKITGGSPGAGKILTSDANGLASWGSTSSVISANNGLTLTGSNISLGGGLLTNATIDMQGYSMFLKDTGSRSTLFVGADKSAGNTGYLAFTNNGPASPNNYIGLGFWGKDDILGIKYDGSVNATGAVYAPSVQATGIVSSGIASSGKALLVPGDGSKSGYVDFYKPDGNRLGYIGYSNSNIGYYSNGGSHDFNGIINAGGIRAWGSSIGYVELNPGQSSTSGALVIYKAGGVRMGYVGWDANNMYYNSDTGSHVFNTTIQTPRIQGSSDRRFKKDIYKIYDATEKLNQLNGYTYVWRDKKEFPGQVLGEGKDMGVIAQEVEAVFPDAVSTNKDGYKSVNYNALIPVLIEALKDSNKKIETLQKEVAELKTVAR